jgi:D-glycerate 3-kinase
MEAQLGAALRSAYAPLLADVLALRARRESEPVVFGLCGSQGSGKSTLARVLQAALQDDHGLAVAVISLDDLYLPSTERARLAATVHALLRTRGVPGTHDVGLGVDVIQRLLHAQPGATARLPRFDKLVDEPVPPDQWQPFHGRADVVLFEGWCVGALPQDCADLAVPINVLEREHDADGRWRCYVNEQLAGPYRRLFGLIDRLAMLQAPGFEVVFEWRRQQEHELARHARQSGGASAARVMSDAELQRFVMHYERLTRHILAEMPGRADVLVTLDARRNIVALERR